MESKEELYKRVEAAAKRVFLDPQLVWSLIQTESDFKPKATSKKGAMGLMQVMPKTAEECGIQNAYHIADNLMGACECLRKLINRFNGDLALALAAYNAGASNVLKYNGIPPFRETQRYVAEILDRYYKMSGPVMSASPKSNKKPLLKPKLKEGF